MRILAVLLVLLAGCSAEPVANQDVPTETVTTPPAAQAPAIGLAELCSDLDVVDATFTAFSDDVGKAAVAEAQGVAGVVVEQGNALLPDAPADIKTELSTVIAATQEALGDLAAPDLQAAGEVMARDDVVAAREAIGSYAPCG